MVDMSDMHCDICGTDTRIWTLLIDGTVVCHDCMHGWRVSNGHEADTPREMRGVPDGA